MASASNKENELDDCIGNSLPIRKARTSSNGGSRRNFGKFLDSTINEIREENDLKLAMHHQSRESDNYIRGKHADEKMSQQGNAGHSCTHCTCPPNSSTTNADREYADYLARQELSNRLSPHADDKHTPIKRSAAGDSKHEPAECKGLTFELSPEEEKECTPHFDDRNGCKIEDGFLDDERYHMLEDERIANNLQIAEAKEAHKRRISELFDADYARHLAEDASHDSHVCYSAYTDKKWDNVESYLDDVEGGICIALLLPDLGSYDVSICNDYSVQVDAMRATKQADGSDVEYKADYSFEGATKGITCDMLQHEFVKQSGILFIFVERLKLRGPSSQCYISPSKSKGEELEKPQLVNKTEENHFVNKNKTALKTNTFMLRVKKSTLGRMLSFNK